MSIAPTRPAVLPGTRLFRAGVMAGLLALSLGGLAVPPPAHADLAEGRAAVRAGDMTRAFKAFLAEAEAGNGEAQFLVGQMMTTGQGTRRDVPGALVWLEKAATGGHTGARMMAGTIYAFGDGVPADYPKALSLLKPAAEAGDPLAQNNYAVLLYFGLGTPSDVVRALAWTMRAEQSGLVQAISFRQEIESAATPEQKQAARDLLPTLPTGRPNRTTIASSPSPAAPAAAPPEPAPESQAEQSSPEPAPSPALPQPTPESPQDSPQESQRESQQASPPGDTVEGASPPAPAAAAAPERQPEPTSARAEVPPPPLVPSRPTAAPPPPPKRTDESAPTGPQPGAQEPAVPVPSSSPPQPARPAPSEPARRPADAPPPARPETAPRPASPPAAPAGEIWAVQVAALPTAEAAEAQRSTITRAQSALLKNQRVDILVTRVEGKGTFHRILVGEFPNREAATAFCRRLKAAGQDCLTRQR